MNELLPPTAIQTIDMTEFIKLRNFVAVIYNLLFYLFSVGSEIAEGEDTDYLMCITDRLIQNEADGLLLAKAVHDITGIPLQRITFWHHAKDDSLEEFQINYRKHYMLHVIDNLT